MSDAQGGSDNPDWVWLITIGVFIGPGALFAMASGFLPGVRAWLLEHNVVVAGDAVLVPLGPDVGLDLIRIIIGAVSLLLIGVLGALIIRATARREPDRRRPR